MKQIAVVLAAILSLTLVAPALAQPFADVPTDHWAYDAIAELAAKGLIEGYPDGAFRGDRAMTRYEMAMVVARLLARIEAIKIPPLPADLVRRAELTKVTGATAAALAATDKRLTAKLATIQRLVAEFRAELAALGVRVTAVEEELAAIRARLDNTRVTGDARIRYNVYPQGAVSGSGTSRAPDVRLRMRVQFSGRAGSNVEGVLRLWAINGTACEGAGTAGNPAGVGAFCGNTDQRFGNNYNMGAVSYDLAYVDVRNTFGASLWRVGRQYYTLSPIGAHGTGLVYDPPNSIADGFTFVNGLVLGGINIGTSDGIRSDWALGPLNITAAVFRDALLDAGTGSTGAGLTQGLGGGPAIDHRILSASTGALIPGWTLGGHYYQAWQHPVCPATTVPGTTFNNCSGGSSWGLNLTGTLIPGVMIFLDYATWASIPAPGAATLSGANAWRVGGNINLGQLVGMTTWNPNLDWAYQSFGPLPVGAIPPAYSYATTITGQAFNWNLRGWYFRLNLTFNPRATAWAIYETGTVLCTTAGGAGGVPAATIGSCASATASYTEFWLRFVYNIAPRTNVALNWYKGNTGLAVPGVNAAFAGDYFNFYRAELLYSW